MVASIGAQHRVANSAVLIVSFNPMDVSVGSGGIIYMSTMYRTTMAAGEGLKNSASAFPGKNLNIRHRNYSNSRLQTYQPADLDFARLPNDPKKRNEITTSTNHSKELKKYCLNKFKQPVPADKFAAIRKNRSLKVMAQDPSVKQFNRTRVDPASCEELLIERKDENHSESGKLISIKRRVELIRNHHNKRKLTLKDKDAPSSKELPRSDVSLGERLDFVLPETEKVTAAHKIQSENMLGEGLKKCSSSKIKILVKNPFERLMRLEESRQLRKQPSPPETSFQELHESQILQNMEKTVSNFSNRGELEEMLALM